LSLALTAAATVAAYDIPANLQTFYDRVKSGDCKSFVKGNSNLQDGQSNSGFGFCDDLPGAIYLSGPGELGDMDTDCDGSAACGGDGSFQGQTAFDSELQSGGYGLQSLAADKQPYVVLGTNDVPIDTLGGGPVQPLSVVAIVCNNQLHYGIFGDTNGDPSQSTGEASIALGQICFPNDGISGNNGHTQHDVLYLAFTSKDAVPGPNGADWKGSDPKAFEQSIKTLGDKMIAEVLGGGNVDSTSPSSTSVMPIPTRGLLPVVNGGHMPIPTGAFPTGASPSGVPSGVPSGGSNSTLPEKRSYRRAVTFRA